MANNNKRENAPATQLVTTLVAPRLDLSTELYEKTGISPADWRNLVEQVFPGALSAEAVLMAVNYCKSRNLDIMKRPVHIVPMWSKALGKMVETVWPSIAEIRTTAFRTGAYAGLDEIEYGPTVDREWGHAGIDERGNAYDTRRIVSYPEWAKVTVYRMLNGQKCAFTARVRWMESYATASRDTDAPNDMWRKRPYGQLDKCVEAAALRLAFPEEVGNEYAAEEMEGKVRFDGESAPFVEPKRRGPPAAPSIVKAEDAVIEDAVIVEDEGGAKVEEKPVETKPASGPPKAPAGPPKAPTGKPAAAPDGSAPKRTFGDLLKEVRTKFQGAESIGDLEEAWSEFEHYRERLEPVKWAQVVDVYDKQLDYLQAVAANVVGSG